MAYYVVLNGGEISPSSVLGGGTVSPAVQFSGSEIYPSVGGGGANLETRSVSYTPSEAGISDTLLPSAGYDGFDEVDVTIDAIPDTYVGSAIPLRDSTDLATSGATVTVPSGYYEFNASRTIPNASTPYLSSAGITNTGALNVDAELDNGGYLPAGTLPISLANAFTVKGAQTFTPGTTDQTISADQYLTGAQTILGDVNLLASNIADGVTIFGITGTYKGGDWVEETIATSGAVTKALDPYTLYHFTGTLTSLTITLNAPSAGQIAHYHFDFLSGSTAPTLTMPNTVTMPDSFSVEASKRYEVDVLNNYGSVIAWTE